jgi:hypothetical protein
MDSLQGDALSSLVDAITELVVKELELARAGEQVVAASMLAASPPPARPARGPRVLVAAGSEGVPEEAWSALAQAKARPSALVWTGFRQDQLPRSTAADWPLEARGSGWSKVVADYSAVVLLGCDLPTLGSIAALGAGGLPPAGAAVCAVAAGLPVFCESSALEKIRRHSARLAPGFVRTFEEGWRGAAGFGIEFGAATELSAFLARLGGASGGASPASKSGGRDVVTGEDVEAARRAGRRELLVGMGAIVTPLARQQAAEWGIEVKFQ